MFFLGQLHATSFFAYLGVHFSVSTSPDDYLVRRQDGLFVPIAVLAAVALAALWVYRPPVTRLPAGLRHIVLRVVKPVAAIAGLARRSGDQTDSGRR